MNYKEWYLDLSSLKNLTKDEQDNIHIYYREIFHACIDKRFDMAESYFLTLQKAGHIKNSTQENREEK